MDCHSSICEIPYSLKLMCAGVRHAPEIDEKCVFVCAGCSRGRPARSGWRRRCARDATGDRKHGRGNDRDRLHQRPRDLDAAQRSPRDRLRQARVRVR